MLHLTMLLLLYSLPMLAIGHGNIGISSLGLSEGTNSCQPQRRVKHHLHSYANNLRYERNIDQLSSAALDDLELVSRPSPSTLCPDPLDFNVSKHFSEVSDANSLGHMYTSYPSKYREVLDSLQQSRRPLYVGSCAKEYTIFRNDH